MGWRPVLQRRHSHHGPDHLHHQLSLSSQTLALDSINGGRAIHVCTHQWQFTLALALSDHLHDSNFCAAIYCGLSRRETKDKKPNRKLIRYLRPIELHFEFLQLVTIFCSFLELQILRTIMHGFF